MDDDARNEVLRNDDDQYPLWAAGHEVPAGWYRVGKEGSKEECSAYVDEVWTDMRPRSLRERMDAEAQPGSGRPAAPSPPPPDGWLMTAPPRTAARPGSCSALRTPAAARPFSVPGAPRWRQ